MKFFKLFSKAKPTPVYHEEIVYWPTPSTVPSQSQMHWNNQSSASFSSSESATGLKRRNARHGDKWTHIKRCVSCEADNICPTIPGRHPCQQMYYGSPCPGFFDVSLRDAEKSRRVPEGQRVHYANFADRYDRRPTRCVCLIDCFTFNVTSC